MRHGHMQSHDYYHWNEEILSVPGSDVPFRKCVVEAYAHEGSQLMQRRPHTHTHTHTHTHGSPAHGKPCGACLMAAGGDKIKGNLQRSVEGRVPSDL